ncbi:uncharacterized protein LOC122374847 isoform X1 [Amphibalanus amphitrite]|uniref:uncharacterized protein LOC122374847 isoform X1 n=2 Tax=Amphibalanus amphitrite TaxID=1232801 RepID=UPI001C91E8FB|nr:uncharacterized protein LOC122374847 isoform X1 [Amphibalanus amphitrite]XP_043209792.1 uncharacterized protein LOC122374847 isoform X1 [Amphibalanus amphitrite]
MSDLHGAADHIDSEEIGHASHHTAGYCCCNSGCGQCIPECSSCAKCCGSCSSCTPCCDSCASGRCRPWLVVVACFWLSFLSDGVASCFGVLLPELADRIGASIADTSWAGSVLCGGQLIVGPLVSALVNKLGCRQVVIAGSLMSSVAFSLSASASEIGLFIVMYGILGGLGLGMMYLPSVVAVSIHFDTNRALATGIVVCGSGVGTFCLAPLTQYLLDVSGWKGAQLATAALLLTGALMGGVMSEPQSDSEPCRTCCCAVSPSPTPGRQSETSTGPDSEQTSGTGDHRCSVNRAREPLPITTDDRREKAGPASPDDTFLATNTGSYVKMTSPAVPSNAGDLEVACPPAAAPPPAVFLFPEVVIQSASSTGDTLSEGAPSSQQSDESVVTGRHIDPVGPLPDEPLHRETLAASHSHLLRSVDDRSSYLRPGVPSESRPVSGQPRPVSGHLRPVSGHLRPVSGQFRPVSDLLSPRLAVSTPCNQSHTPHTPAAGRGPVPSHLRPLQRADVFFSGRVRSVARVAVTPTGALVSPSSLPPAADTDVQRRLALTSVGSADTVPVREVTPSDRAAGDSFAVLKEMLNVSLLKETPFLLTCIGYSFSMLGYFVPIVYILDEAVQHKVSPPHASMLVAVMGISNTVGRLAVGVLSDMQHMDVLFLNNVSMLGSGLVALLIPLCETYSTYAVVTAVFGLLSAANSTLSSLVLVEMVGLARLTNAFGLTLLFRGVAAVLGTPLAGFVAERTNSYDEPFYMTGGLLIAAALLGFLASGWGRRGCRSAPAETSSNSYRRADSVDT